VSDGVLCVQFGAVDRVLTLSRRSDWSCSELRIGRKFVMDVEWALQQLNDFLALHERVPLEPGEAATRGSKSRSRGTKEERDRLGIVVRHIAEAVWERPKTYPPEAVARELIWELTEGDEVRRRLDLHEPGPQLDADALHPWVWKAASPHWLSGNHAAAVWAAAVNVNSRIRRKVGRLDLGEQKLVQECFSTADPAPGRPRLRLCDNSNPSLFVDLHVGASNFGSGLFVAVRNPLSHVDDGEWLLTEQEALESLTAFSLFARWVDRATVREHEGSKAP